MKRLFGTIGTMGNFMSRMGLVCPPNHQSLVCQTPNEFDFTTLEIEVSTSSKVLKAALDVAIHESMHLHDKQDEEDLTNETSEKREQQMSVQNKEPFDTSVCIPTPFLNLLLCFNAKGPRFRSL